MALQFNRKGIRDKKKPILPPDRLLSGAANRSARRMDYRWAMEMAEDFKKTQASNKQNP